MCWQLQDGKEIFLSLPFPVAWKREGWAHVVQEHHSILHHLLWPNQVEGLDHKTILDDTLYMKNWCSDQPGVVPVSIPVFPPVVDVSVASQ